MDAAVAMIVVGFLLIAAIIGGAVYTDRATDDARTARFTACVSAGQPPSECSLASK